MSINNKLPLYVREEIEQKKLPDIFGKAPELRPTIGWESYMAKLRHENEFLGAINYLLPVIFFLLPSIGAFGGYYWIRCTVGTDLHPALERVLTILGGLSFIGMVLMM